MSAHRQSGKTTAALVLAKQLRQMGCLVVVADLGFLRMQAVDPVDAMFRRLLKLLVEAQQEAEEWALTGLTVQLGPGDPCEDLEFLLRKPALQQVVFILDEADNLNNLSVSQREIVLAVMRTLKQLEVRRQVIHAGVCVNILNGHYVIHMYMYTSSQKMLSIVCYHYSLCASLRCTRCTVLVVCCACSVL
jgi:GMP synthase PP-ATPase subunit